MDFQTAQILIAFVTGVGFIIALLVLSIRYDDPTPFQYNVFRIVLALAAAGFAAVIPGFIDVEISVTMGLLIRAGGALAVFVIVFFFNPALPELKSSNPPIPEKLPDGTPFPIDKREAFFLVWQSLQQLEKAGADLWQKVSDETILAFTEKHRKAETCIEKHAYFFTDEDLNTLEQLLDAADIYRKGKLRLLGVREGIIDGNWEDEAKARVHDKIRSIIDQNQHWLNNYRELLRKIRSSFYTNISA